MFVWERREVAATEVWCVPWIFGGERSLREMNAGACNGDDGGEGRSENIRSERGQTSSDVLCSGSDSGGDNYGSTRTHSL